MVPVAVQKRCGESTKYNNTHFLNPGFPESDVGSGACTLTIDRVSTDICQMKFEFEQL